MHSLLHLLSLLAIAASVVLASPANPGLLATRSYSGAALRAGSARAATNAQRLARGLTPLVPKNLFTPTRVRRQLPSSSPTLTANIGIFKKDGTSLGYLTNQGTVATTQSSITTFSFRNPSSASDVVELITAGTSTRTVLMSYSDGYTMGSGSTNYLTWAITTLSTPAGSRQQGDLTKGPTQYSESTIWSIDPSTGAVGAHWVNPDGSTVPVYFLLGTMTVAGHTTYSLVPVGDTEAFKARYPNVNYSDVTVTVSVL
ncbi:hypothetical protein OE88DRAFT_1809411 [Heliocybe sulcata]|uniref:Uncharacterized protein n=1 Tax=Heliocybe sulcata TaxID=5364 RepID=A0A5C3MWZ6_9AGAM|nr:hypothetical protein OE88DRAFT_1809411 [Heliocybe sulcata]